MLLEKIIDDDITIIQKQKKIQKKQKWALANPLYVQYTGCFFLNILNILYPFSFCLAVLLVTLRDWFSPNWNRFITFSGVSSGIRTNIFNKKMYVTDVCEILSFCIERIKMKFLRFLNLFSISLIWCDFHKKIS